MEDKDIVTPLKKAHWYDRDNLVLFAAMWSLFAATGFGVAGFIVSPTGELHDSVLWLIAQFLLFTSGALGLGAVAQSINGNMRKVNQKISRLEINSRNSSNDENSAEKRDS